MSNYQFQPIREYSFFQGAKLINIVDPRYGYDVGFARVRGALIALFGDPIYQMEYVDDAYLYLVNATDDHGNTWMLSIYQGPTGPAIGGFRQIRGILDVANALANLIIHTEPADFEAVCYYEEDDVTITYRCENGECTVAGEKGRHI